MFFRRGFRWVALLGIALLGAAALAGADAADHPPIRVTRFDDPRPPDACLPDDCSLREAIILANNLPGRDTILLSPGTYDLWFADVYFEDASAVGDLDVTDELVMIGAGMAATTITGYGERAFDVRPGVQVQMSNLSIAGIDGQHAPRQCGRAIWNRGGTLVLDHVEVSTNVMYGSGGGICNEEGGVLTVRDSAIVSNCASFAGEGGGIYNRDSSVTLERVLVRGNCSYVFDGGGIASRSGLLVIRDSLVLDNATSPNAPFGPRRGGGISAGGTVLMENVTVSGNHTEASDTWIGDTDSRGGGLYLWGEAQLTNVTIANNESETTAGGIYVEPGAQVTMTNTIVAGNTGGDCEGLLASAGHNIDGDGSCGLTGPGDISGTDPMLAPLADNGGPTQSMALLPGSPAIDAGDDAACPEADQRGAPRPVDGDGSGGAACDIGAYEAGATVPTPPPSTPTATPPPPLLNGDADCSGVVDSVDALWALRFAAGLGPNAECLFAANVDCSLAVDAVDALLILRHVAALPPGQPSGCPEIGLP